MQAVIDVSVASLAWIVTLYKSRVAFQERRDWRVWSSWLFTFFFALCMTFQVDAVYVSFDNLIGVNNLSWLMAYLLVAVAIYFAASGCRAALSKPDPPWMRPYLFATLLTLVVIFPFGIATGSEQPDHSTPRTVLELLFAEVLYIYAAVLGFIPIQTFAYFYRHETNPVTRLRTGIVLLAASTAFAFFLSGVVFMPINYLQLASPLVRLMNLITRLLMGLAGLLWTLAFLPNWILVQLARPFTFVSKTLALRDLKKIQRRLNRFCPPVVVDNVSLWQCLGNLDFHLYRTVIGILDGKRTLEGYLHNLGGAEPIPTLLSLRPMAFHATNLSPEEWDATMVQEARLLYQTLQHVRDDEKYQTLVTAYQRIARTLPTSRSFIPGVVL